MNVGHIQNINNHFLNLFLHDCYFQSFSYTEYLQRTNTINIKQNEDTKYTVKQEYKEYEMGTKSSPRSLFS